MSYSNDDIGSLYGVDRLSILKELIEATQKGLVTWERDDCTDCIYGIDGEMGPYRLYIEGRGMRLWIFMPDGNKAVIENQGGMLEEALEDLWSVACARAAPTELVQQFYDYLSSVEEDRATDNEAVHNST